MKATEKINFTIMLEKGIKKLNLEELHLVKTTLNKEIENKNKLLFRGEKLHNAVDAREARKERR